ncbi:hypothetical protein KJA16_03100 [Patescibacteria group bacterium]|nr:hypothetical protein [Patescibacteria group bacterium]
MHKDRKRGIGGLIFFIGLIAILIGGMTDIYDAKIGVLIALIIWFIGGAIARIILSGERETPKPSEPPQQ